MTQEKFIEELIEGGYLFKREGDEILVTHQGRVWTSLESLPPGVRFQNQGHVDCSLKSLSPDVRFENQGNVSLNSLETLPPGVRFENQGDVNLLSLKRVPPGIRFENQGRVNLYSLVGVRFNKWEGNIKGVDYKRLLNLMIDKGVFV